MKLKTPTILMATILAMLTTINTATAQGQPPQCAYFIFTAQDFAYVNNAQYSNNLSELFTLTPNWDDQTVCAGFELSSNAPTNLNSIGNNLIEATDTNFTAYVWNNDSAWRVTPLAVEPYATAGMPTQTETDLPIIIANQPTEPAAQTSDQEPDETAVEVVYSDPIIEDVTYDDPITDQTAYNEPVNHEPINDENLADQPADLNLPPEEPAQATDQPDTNTPNAATRTEPAPSSLMVETNRPSVDATDDNYYPHANYQETPIGNAEPTTEDEPITEAPADQPEIDQVEETADTAVAEETPPAQAETEAPSTAQGTLEDAWEQLELGNYSTAALYFTRLTQEDISNISAHDGLSRARYAQGALTSAATTLEIAISIDPTNYTLNANLGNILIQTGQYEKAITVLDATLEISTNNPEHLAQAHANLALAFERTGQPIKAAEHYAEAFNLDPQPAYKTREFHALNASGQTTSLIPQLLTHTQQHPSTDLHLLAAQIYHSLGDHPSRDHQIQLALETATTDEDKARALTYQATTNLNVTEAINQYQEAAQLSPTQWEAHYNAGILSLNNNDPANAVTHLQRASQLTNRLDVQASLARAHLNNGDPSSALHYAQTALASDNADLRLHAAETALHAAYQLGDYSAVAQLETHFGSHNNPDTLTLLGTSNYNLGNYSTAALQLQAAYNLRPTTGLKHTLAFAYLAAYQAMNALPLLQELVNEAPMDGQLQHALGWAHQMTGNTIDSQLAFRRATALGYH